MKPYWYSTIPLYEAMKTPDFKLPLKPGRTSTEFWLVITVNLLTGLISAMSLLDVTYAAMIISGLTFGYNHSRTKLKIIQADTEAHFVKAGADVAAAKALANSETPPTQG